MSLRRPGRADLERAASSQATAQSSLSYEARFLGASADPARLVETVQAGYTIDRYGVALGHGQPVFDAAKEALSNWRHCDFGWVRVVQDPNAPLAIGTNLAICVHAVPFHFTNGGRVTVCEQGSDATTSWIRLGYGTLTDHAEQGEETFTVSLDHTTGDVRYDVVAFSRPRLWAARLLRRRTRQLQRRFARDTCAAMQRAVLETHA